MNGNGNKKIFFAIVGVASLVVAVIGATFAYFLVSVSGTNSAVSATSLAVSGKITLTENTTYIRTNLIPTSVTNAKASYAQTGSGAKAKCAGVAANNTSTVYNLCSAYTFTVSNAATTAQTVKITLTSVTKTFSNLRYCLYTGGTAPGDASCVAVPNQGSSTTLVSALNLAASTGTQTYTILLYVFDTGSDQTTSDSGKTYTGRVDVTTNTGQNLTGILST